jgi:endonuclease YncB( thermonuclease family)
MRKVLFILCILASCLLAQTELEGKVVRVIDGDSIVVLCQKTTYEIRLEGVDCPEMGQPFGKTAKKFTSRLVYGEIVTVQVKELDKYGRTVGTVFLSDGTNLCQELVKSGLAWWYRQYSPYDEMLKELELEARLDKRGLWSQPDPTPPWEKRAEEE